MYIPELQNLPGGTEQASKTIEWLRGEIEIPEIYDGIIEIKAIAREQVKEQKLQSNLRITG